MIAIIDYGMGNLRSVQKGFEKTGHAATVTRDATQIEAAAGVVLPGVGAFGACMDGLTACGLVETVYRVVEWARRFSVSVWACRFCFRKVPSLVGCAGWIS